MQRNHKQRTGACLALARLICYHTPISSTYGGWAETRETHSLLNVCIPVCAAPVRTSTVITGQTAVLVVSRKLLQQYVPGTWSLDPGTSTERSVAVARYEEQFVQQYPSDRKYTGGCFIFTLYKSSLIFTTRLVPGLVGPHLRCCVVFAKL